jgi:hypothetical protein
MNGKEHNDFAFSGPTKFRAARLGENPVNNFTGGICLPVGRDFGKVAHGLRNKEKAVSADQRAKSCAYLSGRHRMVNHCPCVAHFPGVNARLKAPGSAADCRLNCFANVTL